MKTQSATSANQDPIDQSPTEAASAQESKPAAASVPQKTITGFAKAWAIFWIVVNLAGTCAPANTLSSSPAAGLVALVMLLCAATALGYFLLLYKNPTGLYMILIANLLGVFMNGIKVPGYSISVQTGLIIGIITYFITRKQVPYPFWKPTAIK